jgi:myo-inositol-1(or 4)-monophosphatase
MSDPQRYSADLGLALRAVEAAAAAIRAHDGGGEVHHKSADQPVSEADLAADRELHRILCGERPEYGWLSEETVDSGERLARTFVWVVDPIDGTRSFLDGHPEYGISVALVQDGVPVVGVVANPATGETYHAVRGGGAYRDGVPIHVQADPAEPVLLAARGDLHDGLFEDLPPGWKVRPLGSTVYKMVKVAEGMATAYLSAWTKHEWDVCAAALIVEEAGGTASDVRGRTLRFNRRDPAVHGILVCSGAQRDALVAFGHQVRARLVAQEERSTA